jgi:CheY-like chemotaxis protein
VLAGGIAHDFNNLLVGILGNASLVLDSMPGFDVNRASLRDVVTAAERAADLTRQLLAFSRQQVLEPTVLDLNEVARGLAPMLGRLIGEDIEIATLAGRDLPVVLADRAQVEQVVINLAINARDAMPTGGTLTIETGAARVDAGGEVEPGRYAYLKVSDSGTGIEPDALEHIFEPFFTTKAVGFGTGLGLATVHGIVTQSNGFVRVDSEPGLGASFTVHLPAAEPDVAGVERAPPQEPASRMGGTETILLCEDEDSVRRLIELLLVSEGYTVLATGHPDAALRLAAERGRAIAALVTDIVMPTMSGLELAQRLGNPRTLFVSGYASEVAEQRGKLPPGSAFLEKPFDHASLLKSLRNLLDHPVRSDARFPNPRTPG